MTTSELRKQVEELSIRQSVLEQQNVELRHLKDNLQESASEFKDLYDNAPVGYLTLDSEARILGSNPLGLTLLQAQPQSVQNKPFTHFIHRKDEDTFAFFHKKLIETHEPQTCFLRVGGQAGENFRYLRLDATTGLNGRSLHIRMTLTDISNQVHAEQYLRTSEQNYHLLAESSQIGIWIINEGGQTTYTNPTLGRMLGYTGEELQEISIWQTLSLTGDITPDRVWEALWKGATLQTRQTMKTKNGESCAVDISASPLSDARQQFSGALFTITDMRELLDSRQQLARFIARSEMQQELLDGRERERILIARKIHDGPLQALLGILFLLADAAGQSSDAHQTDVLEEIQDEMQAEIQGLRELYYELQPPALIPFGLNAAISSYIQSHHATGVKVKFEETLDTVQHPINQIAKLTLFRIFQELYDNAVNHAQASEIEVHLQIAEPELQLTIKDNGSGFTVPQDWLETARSGRLGLVSARERAEALGGYIVIQSTPGEGSVMRLTAPLKNMLAE